MFRSQPYDMQTPNSEAPGRTWGSQLVFLTAGGERSSEMVIAQPIRDQTVNTGMNKSTRVSDGPNLLHSLSQTKSMMWMPCI
jgi:hypothetical protein